jgi:ferric-dicitrate binding protein FerR (iron transport regulator)
MAQIDRAHVVRSSVAYRRRWIAGPLVGLAAAALFFMSLTTVPMGRRLLARVVGVQADFDIWTAVGEQRSILLADGSRVTIEPDSRLSYRASLLEPAQLVTLQGAATFDVVSQHFRKFRVAGGRIFVEVEGTRFGVRAYADEPEASVSVSRGMVRVAGPDFRDVQVDSGFAARVVNRTVQIQRVPQGVVSWNGQELEFNSVPLGTIVATLRHWDGSRIRLADADLAAKVLTVTTTLTDSGTVAALQSFMHVSVRWDGDSVLVYDPARR